MARVQVIEWRPEPGGQTIALSRSEDEILCGGKRGGGKSEIGRAWIMEPEYIKNPGYQGLVIRQDANDLDDWLMKMRWKIQGLGQIVGTPPRVQFNSGAIIRTGHWKDKGTISKFQGKEYQKMLFEELTLGFRTLDEYKMLRASCRSSDHSMRPQIMANTNPGGPGHKWVKEYWLEIPERVPCTACNGDPDKIRHCEVCEGTGAKRTGRVVSSEFQPYRDPVSGLWRVYIPFGVEDNSKLPPQYTAQLRDLPEPLRSAWLYGLWDALEGQFFRQVGLREQPWDIGPERASGRLFGSLDVGSVHPTSFGLWYMDHHSRFHRLFTYKSKASSHAAHARAIRDRIGSFKWTGGVFPMVVWVGHDAWTKRRMSEDYVRSAIDEYEDVFKDEDSGRPLTKFVMANNDREAGCMQMREAFDDKNDGIPQVSYWGQYNKTYEEDLLAMMTDENHPETYEKVDGIDDTPDEARYGIVGLRSWIAKETRARVTSQRTKRVPIRDGATEEYGQMIGEVALA